MYQPGWFVIARQILHPQAWVMHKDVHHTVHTVIRWNDTSAYCYCSWMVCPQTWGSAKTCGTWGGHKFGATVWECLSDSDPEFPLATLQIHAVRKPCGLLDSPSRLIIRYHVIVLFISRNMTWNWLSVELRSPVRYNLFQIRQALYGSMFFLC